MEVDAGRLDLPLCVSSGQVFRWHELPDGRWQGVDGPNVHLVTISQGEPFDRFAVESNASEEDFRRLFRLDWDAEDVEKRIVSRGPELASYLSMLKGLRVLRQSDPVETLFTFLCTPNNHLVRIKRMVESLASLGEPLPSLGLGEVYRFPTIERIGALAETELRSAGFGYRAATIPVVAKQLLERGGETWVADLVRESYETVHRELCSLRGIGPKLADCIALFGFDKTEAVPIDTHIWQAIVRLYKPEWKGKALTHARYQLASAEFRARFGELSGWAHQFLFYENLISWRQRAASPN